MIVRDADLDPSSATVHFIKARPGDPCHRCSKPLTTPFVMWQCNDRDGTQIALHGGCAELLAANLLADASEALEKSPISS